MNRREIKMILPILQAFSDGKTLQCKAFRKDSFKWVDVDSISPFVFEDLASSCYRIKPKTFQNFELPWSFIDQRWNYATYVSNAYGAATAGVILYEKKPKFCEPEQGELCSNGWSSEGNLCTFLPLVVNQEGINECDWLACRNPEGEA